MKKRLTAFAGAIFLALALLAGCSGQNAGEGSTSRESTSQESASQESTSRESASQEQTENGGASSNDAAPENEKASVDLEDGTYSADFDTDNTMFRVNEACEGKGTLTVKNGEMTIHVSLVSKNIVNLYPGVSEDARKDGAELLEPTTDTVTYSDGISEEVYGFDIPVPVLDEEFDMALIGTKGVWYDHKVIVSNPEPLENK